MFFFTSGTSLPRGNRNSLPVFEAQGLGRVRSPVRFTKHFDFHKEINKDVAQGQQFQRKSNKTMPRARIPGENQIALVPGLAFPPVEIEFSRPMALGVSCP